MMRIEPVDERDSSWESHPQAYRVYIFTPGGSSWGTQTYDVTDAQVLEVAAWAAERAGADGLYAVALISECDPGGQPKRGVIWLSGMDANDQPKDQWEQRLMSEMHARRDRRTGP